MIAVANTKHVKLLVLAIIFLYFISLRLSFGVDVDVDTDNNIGKIYVSFFFIPVFIKKINIKKLLSGRDERLPQADKEQEPEENPKDSGAFKKFLLACAMQILKAICVRKARFNAKIGTGDAAADGMAVGILRIMYSQFCAYFGIDFDSATIAPDYNAEILLIDFFGIFSISFADIIFAVCCVVFNKIAHFGKRRSYANVAE